MTKFFRLNGWSAGLFWAWLCLVVGTPALGQTAMADEPLVNNARAIAVALRTDDVIAAREALQHRSSLEDFNMTSWLALELSLDQAFTDGSVLWGNTLKQSIALHFDARHDEALDLARAAILFDEQPTMSLHPHLWLAHLEVWPYTVQNFEQFSSQRADGTARLVRLRSDYPQDRRIAKLLAQALIADGQIVGAFTILDELTRSGELEVHWRADADRFADWSPALDKDDIAMLQSTELEYESLPDFNRDGYVFNDLERLEYSPESMSEQQLNALDLQDLPDLHKLAATGDRQMLDRLLPTVLDIDQTAVRGGSSYTSMHLAAEMGNLEALEAFAGHGASIDQPADPIKGLEAISRKLGSGVSHGTPLQVATLHGQSGLANALVDLGAAVEPTKSEQIAPLLAATARGDTDLVHKLMDAGADPDLQQGSMGTARELAGRLDAAGLAEGLPPVMTASPTELVMLQASSAIGGVGSGMGASYGAAASSVIGLVSSDAGQEVIQYGLIQSWQNGSLFVRFGMMATLMFAGFVIKYGPKMLIRAINRLMAALEHQERDEGVSELDVRRRTYRGQVAAPNFGITEGGEVEVDIDRLIVRGFGLTELWENEPWLITVVRLALKVCLSVLVILFWAVIMVALDIAGSTTAHAISFALFLVVVPTLGLVSDGLVRIMSTCPREMEIHYQDVEWAQMSSVRVGAQLSAHIQKGSGLGGEVTFLARRVQTVQAVLTEMQRFGAGRQVRTI